MKKSKEKIGSGYSGTRLPVIGNPPFNRRNKNAFDTMEL